MAKKNGARSIITINGNPVEQQNIKSKYLDFIDNTRIDTATYKAAKQAVDGLYNGIVAAQVTHFGWIATKARHLYELPETEQTAFDVANIATYDDCITYHFTVRTAQSWEQDAPNKRLEMYARYGVLKINDIWQFNLKTSLCGMIPAIKAINKQTQVCEISITYKSYNTLKGFAKWLRAQGIECNADSSITRTYTWNGSSAEWQADAKQYQEYRTQYALACMGK